MNRPTRNPDDLEATTDGSASLYGSAPTPPASSSESESDSKHDEQLALLLDELIQRAKAGERVDIQQVAAECEPEMAAELRQLWGAVMLADAVGSEAGRQTPSSGPAAEDSEALFQLPCELGDYELLEELGRGGMGVVYRARQKSLNRIVAVKMILRGQLASETDRQRFRAEAEAAARLDHPNIVPVYDVGEMGGKPYFTMKYVDGETIAARGARRVMSPREAAELLEKIGRAIHYAHGQGVLHRDLKPSNIIIDVKGEPHVTDFGLAKQVEEGASLTKTGMVLGTPAYMPPEQAVGNRGQFGPASDVYSLGAILYFMLTGAPPFQANSPVDVVLLVLEQDPVLPRVINPQANPDLEMIALRSLQKPPDLRYDTAADLADDLQAFLNDESISARSGHFAQVVSRWFRETHHAQVLENWGLLWMWHSLVLLAICLMTNALYWFEYRDRWHYFLLWTAVVGTWASIFWALRRRMGPVTFVERQIAHVWASSMVAIALLFPIEWILDEPVLKLSPVLGLVTGMVFVVKAGILTGMFYIPALALFAAAFAMAIWPQAAHMIFGFTSAACFFFPGLKYYRQRVKASRHTT